MRILHGNERMDQLKSMFDLAMQSMVLYRSDTFWAYTPPIWIICKIIYPQDSGNTKNAAISRYLRNCPNFITMLKTENRC